jgi:hypothetical protein
MNLNTISLRALVVGKAPKNTHTHTPWVSLGLVVRVSKVFELLGFLGFSKKVLEFLGFVARPGSPRIRRRFQGFGGLHRPTLTKQGAIPLARPKWSW